MILKRTTVLLLTASLAALSACDRKQSAPEQTPAAPAPGAAPQPAPQTAAPASTPRASTSDEDHTTQATPQGAVFIFTDAMAKGDFMLASQVSDPTSVGYADLVKLADAFKIAAERNPDQASQLEAVIAILSNGWVGLQTEMISMREDRARFNFTFRSGATRAVDVIESNGIWRIFIPEKLIDASFSAASPDADREDGEPEDDYDDFDDEDEG